MSSDLTDWFSQINKYAEMDPESQAALLENNLDDISQTIQTVTQNAINESDLKLSRTLQKKFSVLREKIRKLLRGHSEDSPSFSKIVNVIDQLFICEHNLYINTLPIRDAIYYQQSEGGKDSPRIDFQAIKISEERSEDSPIIMDYSAMENSNADLLSKIYVCSRIDPDKEPYNALRLVGELDNICQTVQAITKRGAGEDTDSCLRDFSIIYKNLQKLLRSYPPESTHYLNITSTIDVVRTCMDDLFKRIQMNKEGGSMFSTDDMPNITPS